MNEGSQIHTEREREKCKDLLSEAEAELVEVKNILLLLDRLSESRSISL